ncbi:MAG: hypothetical protein RIC36_13470 [Rhodospirillales bacterium]
MAGKTEKGDLATSGGAEQPEGPVTSTDNPAAGNSAGLDELSKLGAISPDLLDLLNEMRQSPGEAPDRPSAPRQPARPNRPQKPD